MTRQNVTDGPREILTQKCPECGGDGFVVSDATVAIEIERQLRGIAKGARAQAFKISVHPRVLSLLVGPGGSRLAEIEALARRRFFLVPATNGHVHVDHFEVLEQGKLEALAPAAPVKEDQTIELKLVEVGLHDAAAGVGKLDGYDVVVAGAAKLVGKKVSTKVVRVLDGVAYATLADEAAPAARITFEAEAEKPTRAPSRKKEEPEAPAKAEPEPELELIEPEELEAIGQPIAEPSAEEDADAPEKPAKKRTRRGTRGGRGRKKKASAPAGEAAADGDGSRPVPTIHVPPADLGSSETESEDAAEEGTGSAEEASEAGEALDGQPKRKRTRRGSRGGRRRRKPPASDNGQQVEESSDEPAVTPEDEEPGYVPMSEWIEDFDARRPGV
jgi:predicted RNA-binding protein with TRAM domain